MAVTLPAEPQRCPNCRTKIVVPAERGLVVHNAILRVSVENGHASAKCPRCKPLTYRE